MLRKGARRSFLFLCLAALLPLSGCLPAAGIPLTRPTNITQIEIFVSPDHQPLYSQKLAIVPFPSPPYAPGSGRVVTHAFFRALVGSGIYRQVVLLDRFPENNDEISQSSYLKDFDLLLRGKIVRLVPASFGTSNQLEVEIEIVNIPSRTLIWYVRFQAFSQAGSDIDLVWQTVPGMSADTYQMLAETTAAQLAAILQPPKIGTEEIPVRSPLDREPTGTAQNS